MRADQTIPGWAVAVQRCEQERVTMTEWEQGGNEVADGSIRSKVEEGSPGGAEPGGPGSATLPDGSVVELVPVGQRVLLENEHTRVWEVSLDPGEGQPWHRHDHPYLVLAIEPGDNRIDALDGAVRHVHEPVGGVVYRDPGEVHRLTNIGTTHYRSRLVELLDAPAGDHYAGAHDADGPAMTGQDPR